MGNLNGAQIWLALQTIKTSALVKSKLHTFCLDSSSFMSWTVVMKYGDHKMVQRVSSPNYTPSVYKCIPSGLTTTDH